MRIGQRDSTQLAALGTRQSGQPLTRSQNFNPKWFPQTREICIARDQCSRPGRQSGFDKLIIVPVATNLLAQFHRCHPCGGRSHRVEPRFYLRVELFPRFDFTEHTFIFDKNRFGNDGANQTAEPRLYTGVRFVSPEHAGHKHARVQSDELHRRTLQRACFTMAAACFAE